MALHMAPRWRHLAVYQLAQNAANDAATSVADIA